GRPDRSGGPGGHGPAPHRRPAALGPAPHPALRRAHHPHDRHQHLLHAVHHCAAGGHVPAVRHADRRAGRGPGARPDHGQHGRLRRPGRRRHRRHPGPGGPAQRLPAPADRGGHVPAHLPGRLGHRRQPGPLPRLAPLVVLWLGLLPTILVGLVLGMVLKGGAAMAGGVVTMMAMAILGGLWMPLEMFPDWMQTLGKFIPTYWISRLGEWTMYGGDLPATGLLVIGAWTLVLATVTAVSMSRAVGLSRR